MKNYLQAIRRGFYLILILISALSAQQLTAQNPVGMSIQNVSVMNGETFTVSLNADSVLTRKGIFGYRIGLSFPAARLEFLGLDSVGGILKNWGMPAINSSTPGQILLAGAGANPLTGSGAMFYLRFRAKEAVSSTISNITSYSMLNEGSPVLNLKSGYITVSAIPVPSIFPTGKVMYVGETVQMTASGGTPPYTFASANQAVATVNAAGLVHSSAPGTTKISVTDKNGATASTSGVIDVRGVKLSVEYTETALQDIFYLPVKIEIAPGTQIYSGGFELAFNNNLIGITSNNQTGDFPVSIQNNAVGNVVKVSFASGAPLTGTGIICRIAMKAINSGTHAVSIQNALLNENLLTINTSGNVKAQCQPTVGAIGLTPENGAVNLNSTVDLYWEPALNARYYQLFLWENGAAAPTTPFRTSISQTTTRLTNLIPGRVYRWKIVSVNDCSTVESNEQIFTVKSLPDLVPSDIQAPAVIQSGSQVTVSFTVTNSGQTGTLTGQWRDGLYISTSSSLNGSKTLLAAKYNPKQLNANESYVQSFTVTIPSEYSGNYYFFAQTDVNSALSELDESNNLTVRANPVNIVLQPFPDILVKEIQATETSIVPNDSLTISWKVENIGVSEAKGGWSERVTLVGSGGQRVLLSPMLTQGMDLPAGQTVNRTYRFKIPRILRFSGSTNVEVELIPSSSLIEHSDTKANNKAVSAAAVNTVDKLFLDLGTTSISEASTASVQNIITRSGAINAALSVSLSASQAGQLSFPASVDIPGNSSSGVFNFTTVNNTLVDGPRNVTISASAPSHAAASAVVQILDDEATTLSALLDKNTANEGDVLQLTITRDLVSAEPLTVYIATDKPHQWTFVNAATIPANQSSVTVPIYVTNDNLSELTAEAALKISSGGFVASTVSATIVDDDIPQLAFTLQNDTIQESGGMYATYGTISRVSGEGEIKINLSASVANALILPPSVTLPAGKNEIRFNIGVVDNSQVDGFRNVAVTGAVHLAGCGCSSTPESGGVVSKNLVIADNDGPSLSITITPPSMLEGRVNAGKLIISRNTSTVNPLNITITNSDPNEAEIPSTALIPAGQKSVEVQVNTINDGVEDGTKTVSVSVNSDGFSPAIGYFYVTDLNKPDYELSNVKLDKTTAETGAAVQVTGRMHNKGHLLAPSGSLIGFFLSKDGMVDDNDELIGVFKSPISISIGDSVPFIQSLVLPKKAGNYYIIAKANPTNTVSELVTSNNSSTPIAVTIVPEYSATAVVDLTQTVQNIPITIYGKATKVNGQPAVNADLDIYVMTNGTRRELKAVTDNAGNYSVQFVPVQNESGHFAVGACFPGEKLTTVMDEFDILGIVRTSNAYITWLTKVNVPLTGVIQIRNTSQVPLHNVKLKAEWLPEGAVLDVNTISTLAGNATADFNYTITGAKASVAKDYLHIKLQITSDENTGLETKAYYFCQELESALITNPVSINTTMTKGHSKYFQLVVRNNGAGETGKTVVKIPDVPFMRLVSGDTIANIKPAEEAVITLELAPTADMPLNTPFTGTLAVNPAHGKGLTVPYKIDHISELNGQLTVVATDEYTYNTQEAPFLANAHVVVRHPYSGAILADGFTNGNGQFTTGSIPEGNYTVTVEAEKHEGWRGTMTVEAGKTITKSVFLSFQAITYTWEVVRTEIEDEYKVDLVLEYETNVPKPVIVLEMPKVMPHLEGNETFPFIITATNKGLITANDYELIFPNDSEYEFVTNYTKMDLLAQQSIQIPVVFRRKASGGSNPAPRGMSKAPAANKPCDDVIIDISAYKCGEDGKWQKAFHLFTYSSRICYGTGVNNTPSNGGGGGEPSMGGGIGGGVAGATIPSNIKFSENECDPCALSIAWALGSCLVDGTPVGTVMNIIDCIYAFGDMKLSRNHLFRSGLNIASAMLECGIGFTPYGCTNNVLGAIRKCYEVSNSNSQPKNNIQSATRAPSSEPKPYNPVISDAVINLEKLLAFGTARDNFFNEYFGSSDWKSKQNYIDFIEQLNPFISTNTKFNNENISQLKADLQQSDITAADIDNFAQRWNSTMDAWDNQVYSPNAQFPNIMDKVILISEAIVMDSIMREAAEKGYSSMNNMQYETLEALKKEIKKTQSAVCASVTLNISQKVVMTREAFEGTLTIENGNETKAMSNIKLDLVITNSNGVICNDLFQINTKALSILTGIDGTGTLGAKQKGSATILFIPTKNAAPQTAQSYSFGGSFSYIDPFTGLEVTKPLYPVTLEVQPSPDLHLHYFMQRDILGDNPLTPQVEPMVPAELALMILNEGFGEARNVKVESAQPEIVENEKGLAIHFALIGSNFNGKPMQLGLNDINFGNIAPKKTAIGQWWFTSDLLGHFVKYETRVVHTSSYGNPELSLVNGATLHELIRSVRIYSGDDGINDFLVNDIPDSDDTPDMIYSSNGAVLSVAKANSMVTTGSLTSPAYELELEVTPKLLGWNYGIMNDPTGGMYKVVSVTRQSDGKVLPIDNIWQTDVTLPDGGDPVYENKLHFVDDFSTAQMTKYRIKFTPKQVDAPAVLRIENVPESVSNTQLTTVRVVFKKPINTATFTHDDLILRVQGGENLIDNAVTITEISSTVFDVNLSAKTIADGYYVLTVLTSGIQNLAGVSGVENKQASWTQFTNTPAIMEFIGLPENNAGPAFDEMMIHFTVPINTATFTLNRLEWRKNNVSVSGSGVSMTQMDVDGKLFKLTGLNSIMVQDGLFKLTVDLTQIQSQAGVVGFAPQSVEWLVDTTPPAIASVVADNTNGYDTQHVTSVKVVFTEPVVGFGVSSVELWKNNQQQPVSQLNIEKINDATYLIKDFRLLTYDAGVYKLKISTLSISDLAGNIGVETREYTWTVNRNLPAAVSNLKIAPDYGFSAADGITSTQDITVSMTVNASNARIKLYYDSFGTDALLVDTLPTSIGQFNVPVHIPITGQMKLLAETVDAYGNSSTVELPIFIDQQPLSAQWVESFEVVRRTNPLSVTVKFSDKLLNENDVKNSLITQVNGIVTPISSLDVTKKSDTEFVVSGFAHTGVAAGGIFTLTVNTASLKKYATGMSGSLTQPVTWRLRGNHAPIADAGANQTVEKGNTVVLDGSNSYDSDGDVITYQWTAPAEITLSHANTARPSFETSGAGTYVFSLIVNDGITSSAPSEVTVVIHDLTTTQHVLTLHSIELYPNPAHNEFTLNVGDVESGILSVRIYNNVGKLVYHKEIPHQMGIGKYPITQLNLESGSYIVDVTLNNKKNLGRVKLLNVSK